MARIAGVDLPPQKNIWVGLMRIYGIGQSRSRTILARAAVEPFKKVKDLTEDEVTRIRQTIEEQGGVEGDLRKEISMNIKRLIEIGSYRGQRTHTNARTRKGPRRQTVALKKKVVGKKG